MKAFLPLAILAIVGLVALFVDRFARDLEDEGDDE